MIKNFMVKVKPIKYKNKGVINLLNYLEDKEKHKDGILVSSLYSKDNFIKNCIMNVDEKNLENQMKRKGGRPIESFGDSFVYSLPKGETATKKQLSKIVGFLVKQNYEYIKQSYKNLDYKTFKEQIYVNVHTNEHIHINFVIPKVFKNQDGILITNKISNKKPYLNFTKTLFNKVLNDILGLDYKTYKPQSKLKNGYKNIYQKDIILKKNLEQEKKILEHYENLKKEKENLYKRLNTYLKRTIDNFILEEDEKYEKNLKYFEKTYSKITSGMDLKNRTIFYNEMKKILKNFLSNDEVINKIKNTQKLEELNNYLVDNYLSI